MIKDILEHLTRVPFEPFTIVTSSGKRYPVPTADHAGLNPQRTRVVVWLDDDSSVTLSGSNVSAVESGATSEDVTRK